MTQAHAGWIAIALGGLYAIGLAASPQLFNNWALCPRWGLFGPPASRAAGIGGGLTAVGLGLVHLNTVHAIAPVWLPWSLVGAALLVMFWGGTRPPLYRGGA